MSTTPQTPSDPQAMPLADLKTAAGLDPAAQPAPAPVAAPTPAPPIVPEKFTVSQGDDGVVITLAPEYGGEVFKGKDFNEAALKLAGSKADTNAYVKQLKTQPQQQPAPQAPPQPAPIDPTRLATSNWLADELTVDPAVAKRVLASALGLPNVEALDARLGVLFNTTDKMVEQTAYVEFHKLCPDFVDTPENGSVVGSYFPDNYRPADPITFANDLKTAYALALLDGKIVRQSNQPQPQPAAARPPIMPSAGGSGPTGDQDAWRMPLDQLKQQAGLG